MSSANRRLVIFLPPILTFPLCSSRASDMIRSRKMLKTSLSYSDSCSEPFSYAAIHLDLSKSCSMVRTRFALIMFFCMVAHKAACHTLSKAFLKSVKTWYRFCWCWRYFSHRILFCDASYGSEHSLCFCNYFQSSFAFFTAF